MLTIVDSAKNLWQKPNVLLQKLPAEECMFTTKLSFKPNIKNAEETTGLGYDGNELCRYCITIAT